MTAPARWHKSSYSGEETNCVEVAVAARRTAVRDAKNRDGGTLTFERRAWTGFLSAVRAGQYPSSE